MCVADRKRRALHFKGSVWDESLEIHKHKESDGREIKKGAGRNRNPACCSLGQSASKCPAPKHTRSCLFIQSYPASWTITAQFTPSRSHVPPPSSHTPHVATGCQHIYTSHAHPAPWHLSACAYEQTGAHTLTHTFALAITCMPHIHAHRWTLGGVMKICNRPERRHGTQHACNVQCHDNSETLKPALPHLPPLGSYWGLIAWRLMTV